MPPLPTHSARLGFLATAALLSASADPAMAREEDRIILGVGAAVTPAYQGSDDYRVLPIPVIDVKEGPFFANLRNGIGIEAIDNDVITIGASAMFMPGYRKRDVPVGIDKLSDGIAARIFATVRAQGFVASVGTVKGVAGSTKGIVADASLSYPIQISSRFSLTPTIGATWADRKHNDRYFGVTAAESLASGLPQFQAGAGLKDASAALTAAYRLTDRVTISATGTVTTLLGDAKDSPIVVKQTQPAGFLTLSYRF